MRRFLSLVSFKNWQDSLAQKSHFRKHEGQLKLVGTVSMSMNNSVSGSAVAGHKNMEFRKLQHYFTTRVRELTEDNVITDCRIQ